MQAQLYEMLVMQKQVFDQTAARRPRDAQLWLSRAGFLPLPVNAAEVTQCLKKATENSPKNPDLWVKIGRRLLQVNASEEAGTAFAAALDHAPAGPLFRKTGEP
jgi:predicted Zn-dependent protease